MTPVGANDFCKRCEEKTPSVLRKAVNIVDGELLCAECAPKPEPIKPTPEPEPEVLYQGAQEVAKETRLAIPEKNSRPEKSYHLVASNAVQMSEARAEMKRFLEEKVRLEMSELNDVSNGYELAKKNKWNSSSLNRQVVRCKSRLVYYEKVLAAVNEGYTLVPNFPVDLFAVRVKKDSPVNLTHRLDYSYSRRPEEKPKQLVAGEGHYVSPVVDGIRYDQDVQENDKLVKRHYFEVTDYKDVVFPLVAARHEVMNATQVAMASKIFDAVGICPPRRKGDPLIIGKIFGPKSGYGGGYQKEVSFLIAWHLDLRVI